MSPPQPGALEGRLGWGAGVRLNVCTCVGTCFCGGAPVPAATWAPVGLPSFSLPCPLSWPQGYSLRVFQALASWLGPAPGGWAGLGSLPLLAVVSRIFSLIIPFVFSSPRASIFIFILVLHVIVEDSFLFLLPIPPHGVLFHHLTAVSLALVLPASGLPPPMLPVASLKRQGPNWTL